jgi:hypothetical protein
MIYSTDAAFVPLGLQGQRGNLAHPYGSFVAYVEHPVEHRSGGSGLRWQLSWYGPFPATNRGLFSDCIL